MKDNKKAQAWGGERTFQRAGDVEGVDHHLPLLFSEAAVRGGIVQVLECALDIGTEGRLAGSKVLGGNRHRCLTLRYESRPDRSTKGRTSSSCWEDETNNCGMPRTGNKKSVRPLR